MNEKFCEAHHAVFFLCRTNKKRGGIAKHRADSSAKYRLLWGGQSSDAASNGIVQTDKENQEKGTDSIENERTAQRNERKAWRNKKSERSRTDEKAAPLAFYHESMYT